MQHIEYEARYRQEIEYAQGFKVNNSTFTTVQYTFS